jgi:hypothetical protein
MLQCAPHLSCTFLYSPARISSWLRSYLNCRLNITQVHTRLWARFPPSALFAVPQISLESMREKMLKPQSSYLMLQYGSLWNIHRSMQPAYLSYPHPVRGHFDPEDGDCKLLETLTSTILLHVSTAHIMNLLVFFSLTAGKVMVMSFAEFRFPRTDFCVRPPLWSSGQSSWLQIQRSGFYSWRHQIFWEVVGLERGPLSLASKTEELVGRKSSDSGLESREYGRRDPSRWPRGTLYPLKLALTSPTSGVHPVSIVRSRTQATEFMKCTPILKGPLTVVASVHIRPSKASKHSYVPLLANVRLEPQKHPTVLTSCAVLLTVSTM